MGAMALALFGASDASFAVEKIDTKIDTTANHNNGRLAWEAFSGVAQRVTEGGKEIAQAMRTELNDRFRTFLEVWRNNDYSEDVVSAKDFIQSVTHPFLQNMSYKNFETVFYDVVCDKGRPDILRHCLGSVFFKNRIEFLPGLDDDMACGKGRAYILRHCLGSFNHVTFLGCSPGLDSDDEDSLAEWLLSLYFRAIENHGRVRKSGGDQSAIKRAEDRAIAALFLTDTCFSKFLHWRDYSQEGETRHFTKVPMLLPAQLYYIATGHHLDRPPQNSEDITVVETMLQNANPHQILENLDRIRGLGLKIHKDLALVIFTDSSMNKIAQGIVQQYKDKGETVVSKSFLKRLEGPGTVNRKVGGR